MVFSAKIASSQYIEHLIARCGKWKTSQPLQHLPILLSITLTPQPSTTQPPPTKQRNNTHRSNPRTPTYPSIPSPPTPPPPPNPSAEPKIPQTCSTTLQPTTNVSIRTELLLHRRPWPNRGVPLETPRSGRARRCTCTTSHGPCIVRDLRGRKGPFAA